MTSNQIASAIINDLFSGKFIDSLDSSVISVEQLEDEVYEERASIIKELFIKGALRKEEVLFALNCVPVDCADQNKCECSEVKNPKNAKHFEIPILMNGLGSDALAYIGSTDRTNSFKVFYNREALDYYKYSQKYKRGKKDKPYVFIDKTPNKNGKYDGWVFNAPFIKNLAVIGVFQDPRQLEGYNCCADTDYLELGIISSEIKNRLLTKKLKIYRTASYNAPQVTT